MRLRLLRAVRGGCGPAHRAAARDRSAAQAHEASPTRLFVVVGPAPGAQPEHDSHIQSTGTTRAEPASPPGSPFFVLVRLVRLA